MLVRRLVIPAASLLLAFAIAAACGSSGAPAGSPGDASADSPAAQEAGADAAANDAAANDSASNDSATSDGALPVGAPIVADPGKWTWVDFPDSTCDDGSPTGIGVYPSATSDKLIVYFEGGGACWDYLTCVTLNTSTHGPFGAAQFAAFASGGFAGSILDRTSTASAFKDYSAVFVPYCTGDLHTGDVVTTYTADAGSKAFHHKGRANALAYLARLAATFKAPRQIAVTGSSAGGGGALFNYASFHAYWPSAPMLLVDDSFPLMEGDSINAGVRAAWYSSWGFGTVADPICGAGCRSDLSLFMRAVAKKYPSDRMAILSSTQDQTIRTFFGLTGPQFQTALAALTTDVLDPLGNFRHFYVAGQSHTMLGSPGSYSVNGVALQAWLTQMATGDAAWDSVGP